jgi:hypothetical protein
LYYQQLSSSPVQPALEPAWVGSPTQQTYAAQINLISKYFIYSQPDMRSIVILAKLLA